MCDGIRILKARAEMERHASKEYQGLAIHCKKQNDILAQAKAEIAFLQNRCASLQEKVERAEESYAQLERTVNIGNREKRGKESCFLRAL